MLLDNKKWRSRQPILLNYLTSLIVLSVITIVILLPNIAQSTCINCHAEVLGKAQQQLFIHKPVANKQCTACHLGEISANAAPQTTDQPQPTDSRLADFNPTPQLTWLAETFTPQTMHLALLPQQYAGSKLTLEVWSPQRTKLKIDTEIPPLTTLDNVKPLTQPALKQIHLHEYNIRLLSRATISWRTTTPCRCQISYGSTGDEYDLEEDDLYTCQHQLDIRNFTQNDLFQINCLDPEEHKLGSEKKKLTSLPLQPPPTTTTQQPLTQQQVTTIFKQYNHQIWLEIRAPQPFSVSIGTTRPIEQQQEPDKTPPAVDLTTNVPEVGSINTMPRQKGSTTNEHSSLLSTRDINLKICYRCHQNIREWSSHPVDVIAPPGMVIPPEYPLLPTGKLSCMTCHTIHGGNKEYRLRKNSKRELCIGCHTNY